MIKIDKNIPIPHKTSGKPRNEEMHNALKIMEVGDSLEFETDSTSSNGTAYSKFLGALKSTGRRRYNYKFTERLSDDKSKMRLWRIE